MGLSYAKEFDLIFCRLSTILESSITDRQTDGPRNGNIDLNTRNHLPTMSPKTISLQVNRT